MLGRGWLVGLVALVVSCGTPTMRVDPDADDSIGGTGIDSADVRATADTMARSIVANDRLFARGMPYVIVGNPENKTDFQIDDTIFVNKLVSLLTKNAGGRIQFVDRQNWQAIQKERELKRSGAVSVPTDASGKPILAAAPLGSDYQLFGTLQSISKSNGKARSDYVLVTFKLTDLETGALIWQDDYEWKKVGASGVLYH